MSNVRKRLGSTEKEPHKKEFIKEDELKIDNDSNYHEIPTSYWLTRIVLLRAVSFIYVVGFLVAINQNEALIGTNGLLPGDKELKRIERSIGNQASAWQKVQAAPTLLWFMHYEQDFDWKLNVLQYSGLALASVVLVRGAANIPLMLLLWTLYHSVVNVGQRWYSFGWESQLLETGFLAAFLCPLLSLKQVPARSPPSFIVILAFRWIIFRIMLGAGLIKIRGDQCWRDLTCMNYHYETQPVPNPLSYYMHQSPEPWHWVETAGNHFVELIAPFFIFLNRPMRLVGGVIQVLFQVVLIISGNLSFLNWLTIVPSLACFDDRSLAFLFSDRRGGAKQQVQNVQKSVIDRTAPPPDWGSYVRTVCNLSLGALLVYLSWPVVQNLVSSRQRMNTSFEPLRIVNTYGAFGSITKERTEVIFQGTYAENPDDPKAEWFEYEFKCKPGRTDRRPCVISPFHYRLDWLMWFAAFQNYQYNPWLVHLAAKLLNNDEAALQLMAHNPFHAQAPPRFIRAEHYKYTYTPIGSEAAKAGHWWSRVRIGSYLPTVNLQALQPYLKQMDWLGGASGSNKTRKKRI